ncbi:MAG: proline--tRNA ligase, partial [Anaerolineae bacterium]|nr:proline--tRNA ligase [Anaerolineae bacterium]
VRRDTLAKETVSLDGLYDHVVALLDDIQANIYDRALNFRQENTFEVTSWADFTDKIEKGGFLSAHWDGTAETEEKIKELTKATIRCIPLDFKEEEGQCVYSGKPSKGRVLFAKAY